MIIAGFLVRHNNDVIHLISKSIIKSNISKSPVLIFYWDIRTIGSKVVRLDRFLMSVGRGWDCPGESGLKPAPYQGLPLGCIERKIEHGCNGFVSSEAISLLYNKHRFYDLQSVTGRR
jgi:hypothetical protein